MVSRVDVDDTCSSSVVVIGPLFIALRTEPLHMSVHYCQLLASHVDHSILLVLRGVPLMVSWWWSPGGGVF